MPADDYLAVPPSISAASTALCSLPMKSRPGSAAPAVSSPCEHWGVEPDIVLLAKSLSGGHVPVGAVLTRKWIFDKVFDRMDRAVVHGSTFAKNDLAMAAGLATLDVLQSEKLIQNAADGRASACARFTGMCGADELVKAVRGKG